MYSGIYVENIQINKQLLLEGETCDTTVIDGGEIDSVVTINAENVVISDFTITNCKNSSDCAGVVINANHVEIKDCHILFNKGYGISGRELTDVLIEQNVISYNYYDGIYLESVENSEISHNLIHNHTFMYYSFNDVVPLSHGIVLTASNRIMVSDNVFSDALNVDLVLQSSTNINVEHNQFLSRSGVVIWGGFLHWTTHTIVDNIVDGKPLYYYRNDFIGKTVPEDAGEVILANCRNFKIHNLSIHDGDVGISIGYCNNIEIMNNVIENTAEGIYLDTSHHSQINGNTIVHVWGVPFLYSCNNTFVNNVIDSDFRYGLGLWYGADNNKIYNNTIVNNTEDGIISYESHYNHIIFNIISGNIQSGLELMDSDNNIISGNILFFNNDYGAKLSFDSTNNIFHHNNFINNSAYNAHGGSNNNWDFDPYGGNYWSDYMGVDIDGDGFGDEPYTSGGSIRDNAPYIEQILFICPLKPGMPVGPSSGKILENVSFTFCGTDPCDLDLYYLVDWGDDTEKIWYGPYCSGESLEISHSWTRSKEYDIRVKNKNIIGIESDWSDPLSVSIPKNRMKDLSLFRLLDNNPQLFPLLQLILHLKCDSLEGRI